MWDYYYTVTSISEALEILFKEKEKAKIIAGGTDLVLELKKNSHPEVVTLIDITRISGLDRVWEEGDYIYISPMVTHNHALASKLLINYALPLVKAAQSIGAAQIRNIGTVVGNIRSVCCYILIGRIQLAAVNGICGAIVDSALS